MVCFSFESSCSFNRFPIETILAIFIFFQNKQMSFMMLLVSFTVYVDDDFLIFKPLYSCHNDSSKAII